MRRVDETLSAGQCDGPEAFGDDLQAALEAQIRANGGQRPTRLAADLGTTILQAVALYRQPERIVRQVYRNGVGRCDEWSVQWAPPEALQQVFARSADPEVATRRASVQRAVDRRERLRAKLQQVGS